MFFTRKKPKEKFLLKDSKNGVFVRDISTDGDTLRLRVHSYEFESMESAKVAARVMKRLYPSFDFLVVEA